MKRRKKRIKPRATVTRHGFSPIPEGRKIELSGEFKIAAWCSDDLALKPPEEVHLMFPFEDGHMVLRFKSPDTMGFLIEELAQYRRQVWQHAEPVLGEEPERV